MPPKDIDHLAVVRELRSKYDSMPPGEARGWTITNAVALRLRELGEDAGLLYKPDGSNYHGFKVDGLFYSTGELYDCLGDGEGVATPDWRYVGKLDPGLFRLPLGDVYPPPPPPIPPKPEPPSEPILEVLGAITQVLGQISEKLTKIDTHLDYLRVRSVPGERWRVGF